MLKFNATTIQKNVLIKCVQSPCFTDQTSLTIRTNRTIVFKQSHSWTNPTGVEQRRWNALSPRWFNQSNINCSIVKPRLPESLQYLKLKYADLTSTYKRLACTGLKLVFKFSFDLL